MLKDRNKSAGRGAASKVVAREICSILSKGTRTFCHLDDLSALDDSLTGDSSSILMSVCELLSSSSNSGDGRGDDSSTQAVVEYGICIVNSVLCTVTLAQFEDDRMRNRLRTLICRYSPTEVLLEHGAVSNETLGVLQLLAPKASREMLHSDELPSAELVPQVIQKAKYFHNLSSTGEIGDVEYPPVLQAALSALSDGASRLVIRALGGALWHLKRCCIDFEVMSHGRVFAYVPPDTETLSGDDSAAAAPPALFTNIATPSDYDTSQDSLLSAADGSSSVAAVGAGIGADVDLSPRHMILDAVTLTNLEILVNNFDHTPKGSLYSFMNRCRTPFGKRLLKEWVCKPLVRPADIQNRMDAVSELMDDLSSEAETARSLLKACPDLERLLSRVHSNGGSLPSLPPSILSTLTSSFLGISKQQLSHPDSRAILYENQLYNTRKIKDFAEILRGFDLIVQVADLFQELPFRSPLLKMILSPNSGRFPLSEMRKILSFFRDIFDEKQAKKDGFIRPLPGVDSQYDEALAEVADIERSFEEYLKEQKRATGLSELCFFGTNKDRYQLEVPMAKVSRVPKEWTSKSQKKTHRRYWTSFIEANLAALVQAEERLAFSQKDTMRRVFEKFDQNQRVWRAAVSCIGIFDALLSLVSVSSLPNYSWANVISRDTQTNNSCSSDDSGSKGSGSPPQLEISGGRHPMLEQSLAER
jgi:DNA mismatch repair protein MSH6